MTEEKHRWTIPMLLIRDGRWLPEIWVDTDSEIEVGPRKAIVPSLQLGILYASLRGKNLVSSNRSVTINLAPSEKADTTPVIIGGWVTDRAHSITIESRGSLWPKRS